jgi:cytoskeletal protein CcmA (bactofilin family)/predicted anti-sigma-YlaC factor YlaD
MDHFSELTYSTYADGELPEPERSRVEQHLAQCPVCRARVAALEVESRVLAEAFRLAEETDLAQSRSNIGRSLLITVGSALAVALSLDRLIVGVEQLAPGATSWMNALSLSWFRDALFNNALDLVREGPAMLNALVTVLGLLVLGAIVAGLLRHFLTRHPMSMAVLATMLLALALPRPAAAIEKRSAPSVRIGSEETVNNSLLVNGENLALDGTVNGSVIAFVRKADIRGAIKGDLIVFAQQIEVSGTVEGNLYALSQSATLSGHVERNLYTWAQTLQLDPGGRVDSDVLAGSDVTRLRGAVGRDASVFSGSVDAEGEVGRNLQVYTGALTVARSAHVGGDLEAHVKHRQDADIESGAAIGGKTEISLEQKSHSHYTESKFYYWQAIWMAGALIVGLLLHWLAPAFFAAPLDSGGSLLRSGGVGFLALVAAPIAAIIAFITLVGIPLGVLLLIFWLLGLWLAKIFVGAAVGRGLMRQRPSQPPNFAVPFIVGLLIVFVATNLPYVCGWLSFLIILVGLGLAVLGVRAGMRGRVATA